MKTDYYVYIYLDPRKPGEYVYVDDEGDDLLFYFEPFYVGKGKGNRIFQGFKDPNNTTSKKYKINEIRKYGVNPIALKIYDNISESISYELEKSTIAKIGRESKSDGVLVNKLKGSTSYKRKIEIFKLKSGQLLVYVIGIMSDFYFLNDGSQIHKDLFLKLFEKIN